MTSNMFGGTNIFAIPSKTSNPFQTTPPRPSSPFGSTNSSAQQKQQIMPTKPALQDLQSKIGSKTSGFGSKGEKLGGNQTFGLRNEIIHSGEQKASDTTPKEDMKSSDHSSKNEESTKSPSTPTKLPYSEWQSAVHNSISSTIRDTLPDLDDGKVENLAKALQPTIEKSAVMQSFLTTPASSTFPFQLYGYPQMQFQIPHFQTNETTKIIGNKQITETPEGLQVIVWPEGMDPKTIPKSPPMMYPMMQQMPMMQQCERSSDKSTKDDKNKQSPDAQVPPPQMPMMPPMMSPMMPQMPMMPPMMYPMMQPMPMMPPMMQQMPMMPPMMYPMMQPMPMMQQMPMTPQMMQQPMQSKEASSKDGKNKQSPNVQFLPPQMPMMPPMMPQMMQQMPMMPPMMYPMMPKMPMMPPMMQQMPMMQQPMQSKEASSKDGKNKQSPNVQFFPPQMPMMPPMVPPMTPQMMQQMQQIQQMMQQIPPTMPPPKQCKEPSSAGDTKDDLSSNSSYTFPSVVLQNMDDCANDPSDSYFRMLPSLPQMLNQMPLQQMPQCVKMTNIPTKEFKFDELAQCVQIPPMQYPSPPIGNMMPMMQPLMPSISNITMSPMSNMVPQQILLAGKDGSKTVRCIDLPPIIPVDNDKSQLLPEMNKLFAPPNANISQITSQPNPMNTPPDVPKLIESIKGEQEDRLIAIPKPGN